MGMTAERFTTAPELLPGGLPGPPEPGRAA
jgi:hypothetical protein